MGEIRKVAVTGADIMGTGIAQTGFQVNLTDLDNKLIDRGIENIVESLRKSLPSCLDLSLKVHSNKMKEEEDR